MPNFLIKVNDTIRDVTLESYEHLVGTCPYCEAQVYTKLSHRGLPFVCLYPGEVHSSQICIDNASKKHQPVAGLTTKADFFSKIYAEKTRKVRKPVEKGMLVVRAKEDYDYRALASAKDIRLSGYMDFGPFFQVWNDDISRIAMRAEWLPECYPEDLSGDRIILACFEQLDEKALTCELRMSYMEYHARFLIRGNETAMYDFFKDLCCYQKDEKDRAVIALQSKYSGVYFASKWERYNCTPEECDCAGEQGCEKCYGCYMTELVSPRQYTGAR